MCVDEVDLLGMLTYMTRSMTQAGAHMETVCFALRDTTVVDFVRAVVRAGYRERFSADQDRAERIVEDAFDLLAGSQVEGVDVAQLVQTTSHLIRETFRKGDATFWFNQGYHAYKTRLKPETDFAQLEHLIPGRRVLDYGCGSGYLAARLARGGFRVFTADVLDYRYEEARHLLFVQMSSAADLRYPAHRTESCLSLSRTLQHRHDSSRCYYNERKRLWSSDPACERSSARPETRGLNSTDFCPS